MSAPLRVLILEDRPTDAELMLYELRRAGFEPAWQRVETEADYLAALDPTLDLILADYTLPQFDALRALHLLQERGLDIPFIVVTATVSEEAAVECMKEGAADYLLKDRLARLGPAVERALQEKRLRDEKRQAEIALRESEEKCRSVVERANDGILIIQDAVLKYANSRLAEIWGGTVEEITGTPFASYIHPDELLAVVDRYKQRIAGEDVTPTYEMALKRKDGSRFYVEVNASRITYQGKPADLIIAHDITERKRRERHLAALAQTSAALTSALELDPLLENILSAAIEALPNAEKGSILLLDEASGDLSIRALAGYTDPRIREISFPKKAGYSALATREGRPLLIADARPPDDSIRYDGEIEEMRAIQSAIVAPLRAKGRIIGVISLDNASRKGAFDEEDLKVLSTLADHAAIAIENARLFEETCRLKEFNQSIVQSVSEGIAIQDADGAFTFVNPAAAAMLGYAPEELLGQHWMAIVPPDQQPIVRAADERRRRGEADRYELELVRKDGTRFSALVSGSPRFEDGHLVGTLAVFTDITECKRAEAAEREQRALAEALRDTAAALASTLDFDDVLDRILDNVGRVVPHDAASIMLVEGGVARIVRRRGYSERGLEAQVLALQLPVAELPNLRYMAETGRPFAIPDTAAYPGWMDMPETHWIRSYAGAPIRVKGETIGFINLNSATPYFFSQAHAERLQAFADQAGAALENARLYTSLQEANVQLQAAMRAKDEMIQNVSHELRTPLAIIIGFVELLKNGVFGPLTAEQERIVATLDKQGKRLHFMVHRLLILQTLRPETLRKLPLELGPWLSGVVQPWMDQCAAGVEVRLDVSPNLPLVMADSDLLEQVVVNLLDNAVKFSPNGGVVTVRAGAAPASCLLPPASSPAAAVGGQQEAVIITVTDQGIGIPPDRLEQVFERFYQVDGGATRRFGGMGIGLALCRAIVKAHGGRIWAESEGEGRGSTFCVVLPAASG